MGKSDTVVAVFPNHHAAEAAVKQLAATGFDMKQLSIVGKGYQSEEKVVGFYTTGDRIKFWGTRGAFWGLFLGGLFKRKTPEKRRREPLAIRRRLTKLCDGSA